MTSIREKAVVAALGAAVLYGALAAYWLLDLDSGKKGFGWCPKSWGNAVRTYDKACRRYVDECKLIGEAKKWDDAYEEARSKMPTFAANKATETTWMKKMTDLAQKHHIAIVQTQPGKEDRVDDVFVISIEVKTWEGAFESLVKFMHELENTSEGMFDIAQLNFKPISNKPGYLRGSFTLSCAYMRE